MVVSALFLLSSLGLAILAQGKNCPAVQVANGDIKYDNEGTEPGDKAVVVCKKGYRLIGKAELTCNKNGSGHWIGRQPTCEVVKCVDPPVVANAYFTPELESYDYGTVVTYTCDSGLTLNGSKTLSCSETEQFSPSPPKCVRVDCKDPVIPNADFVSGSRPPHGHQASVTYQCLDGYKMNGSSSLRCEINSEWSPGIPQCIKGQPTNDGDRMSPNGAWTVVLFWYTLLLKGLMEYI